MVRRHCQLDLLHMDGRGGQRWVPEEEGEQIGEQPAMDWEEAMGSGDHSRGCSSASLKAPYERVEFVLEGAGNVHLRLSLSVVV